MNTKFCSSACKRHFVADTKQISTLRNGFSLIELMIAMTVTLILLAGVVQIYMNSKQTYRIQAANSRLQESGRTAITLLQRDIRPAGFQGCRSVNTITPNVVANPPIPVINATTAVRGYEGSSGGWTPVLPSAIATTVTANTDVITIQRGTNCGASLTGNMTVANANIQINFPNACNFSVGQVLVISDCTNADIFRATGVSNGTSTETIAHGNNFNSDPFLSKTYNADADILGFRSLTYFIAPGSNGQPSLWQFDNTSGATAGINPVELVSNVADMQIEYGVDDRNSIDGIPNFYTTADNIPSNAPPGANDWDLVTSVRISLLVQTPSGNIASQPQTYTYNRTSVTAPDRRIYRVFTTTISLRNKVS